MVMKKHKKRVLAVQKPLEIIRIWSILVAIHTCVLMWCAQSTSRWHSMLWTAALAQQLQLQCAYLKYKAEWRTSGVWAMLWVVGGQLWNKIHFRRGTWLWFASRFQNGPIRDLKPILILLSTMIKHRWMISGKNNKTNEIWYRFQLTLAASLTCRH